jgi:hypothetical protein
MLHLSAVTYIHVSMYDYCKPLICKQSIFPFTQLSVMLLTVIRTVTSFGDKNVSSDITFI